MADFGSYRPIMPAATIPSTERSAEDIRLREAFETHVRERLFPCVGAKSALAKGTLQTLACHDLSSSWDDLRIHDRLLEWSEAYVAKPEGFRSLAVIFRTPFMGNEAEFEECLWTRIQSLSDKDNWRGKPYDEAVKADPEDPHFGLSFGGQAYFVVGMHKQASRPARRFERPVMVFNLHDQFVQLREQNRYERMRETILDRDVALAGDINPMLALHGEKSEAAQYSGRVVDADWRPPFSDKRADSGSEKFVTD